MLLTYKLSLSEFTTSNCGAALFGSVHAVHTKKCEAYFFGRSKCSGEAVTQPAGWGGDSNAIKTRK